MKLSLHSQKRSRQRGFSRAGLDIVKRYGRIEYAPGGAVRIFFGKKEKQLMVTDLKKTLQMLDKTQGGTLIVKDNELLTAYHRL